MCAGRYLGSFKDNGDIPISVAERARSDHFSGSDSGGGGGGGIDKGGDLSMKVGEHL